MIHLINKRYLIIIITLTYKRKRKMILKVVAPFNHLSLLRNILTCKLRFMTSKPILIWNNPQEKDKTLIKDTTIKDLLQHREIIL
jgi:hypothetical protein